MRYDLSIILPTVRPNINNLNKFIYGLERASKRYKWELIFVGPFILPDEIHKLYNVKYIKDFGCPSRALQIAAILAEGEYIAWTSDDSWIYENSLDVAIDYIASKNDTDIMMLRYIEGANHMGNPTDFGDFYWTAEYSFCRIGTEADWKLKGINPDWKCGTCNLLNTKYFKWLGGLDCRFEHSNFNVHDLLFRSQKNGGKVYLSPEWFANTDWSGSRTPQNDAIVAAYFENDMPLFKQIYSDNNREIQISYDNWQQAEAVWHRKNYANWPNIETT